MGKLDNSRLIVSDIVYRDEGGDFKGNADVQVAQ